MKAVFKKMLAIGGSMALAGVILSVIGLFFSDGMPKTYFSPREILPSWIANKFLMTGMTICLWSWRVLPMGNSFRWIF